VARKKNPTVKIDVKASLSRRLREIRQEIFGEHGGPELARRLGLTVREWYNYETGVTVPAEVLLGFIEQTNVNPAWLISGTGPKYLRPGGEKPEAELSLAELLRLGLERLERSPEGGDVSAGGPPPGYVPLSLFALDGLTGRPDDSGREGEVLAMREWIPNPRKTIAVRMDDDSMAPVLNEGSIAAIDTSVTDPRRLQGRLVAARPDGRPLVRWLDLSGRHMIFKPNRPAREFPIIPLELESGGPSVIMGQVVFTWNHIRNA
jgi:hypothetical protein